MNLWHFKNESKRERLTSIFDASDWGKGIDSSMRLLIAGVSHVIYANKQSCLGRNPFPSVPSQGEETREVVNNSRTSRFFSPWNVEAPLPPHWCGDLSKMVGLPGEAEHHPDVGSFSSALLWGFPGLKEPGRCQAFLSIRTWWNIPLGLLSFADLEFSWAFSWNQPPGLVWSEVTGKQAGGLEQREQ